MEFMSRYPAGLPEGEACAQKAGSENISSADKASGQPVPLDAQRGAHDQSEPTRRAPGWHDHQVAIFQGTHETRTGSDHYYHLKALAEIWQMVGTPAIGPKDQALNLLPSSYHAPDARSRQAQRERGVFVLLRVDIDRGNVDRETLHHALKAFTGPGVALSMYSTSSAIADNRKWRGLIPLPAGVPYLKWLRLQRALHLHLQ